MSEIAENMQEGLLALTETALAELLYLSGWRAPRRAPP